jgi:isopenicillin N synthase-like dioxygenase
MYVSARVLLCVQIVSNGRYKALLHRSESVVGGERTRMSIACVISPSLDAIVEPVPVPVPVPVPELALDCQAWNSGASWTETTWSISRPASSVVKQH